MYNCVFMLGMSALLTCMALPLVSKLDQKLQNLLSRLRLILESSHLPIGDSSYSADTILNVMSCGKNWESIVMAMLFDKGLFHYEDLVSKLLSKH